MKKLTMAIVVFTTLVFSGCGGSMYYYHVKPTPIKKDKTKYVLNEFNFKLQHGHGRNLANKTFKNEEELKKSFESFLTKSLKEKILFDKNGLKLDIDLDYTRTYNYGGNALNKPEFVYSVTVTDNEGKKLAYFSIPRSTTKYSYFKDLAVNMEISLFKWDAEDEPKDIAFISKTLVKELSQLGK